MPELNLGNKFECFSCGTRFYDLGKHEAICPKCGSNQKDSDRAETPAVSSAARRKRKAPEVVKPIEVEEEVPIEELPEGEIAEVELEAEVEEVEEEDVDDDD
ncbi:MAG TPA: FYDLN acid domain-containing protein [Thermoanaerobaculia bacterium]|nr:FYDLN acid domain-containing protein [Thermoanaerobaculia bacterium]